MYYTPILFRWQGCLFYLPRFFWIAMEEGKLNSMLEGLIAGKKKEEKSEDKKKIAEEEVADNVIQYIHMKEAGHLKYGLTFLVSQVNGVLYQLCLLGTFFNGLYTL